MSKKRKMVVSKKEIPVIANTPIIRQNSKAGFSFKP